MRQVANCPEAAVAAQALLAEYMSVQRGEEVLITIDSDTDAVLPDAVAAAAALLGASVVTIKTRRLPFQGALADPYISRVLAAAVQAADVWVDLCWPYAAGSRPHDEAMGNGRLRYFLGGDIDSRAAERLLGRIDLGAYAKFAALFRAFIAAAVGKPCRITCPKGTDIRFRLGKSTLGPRIVFAPGALSLPPEIESVEGVVVLSSIFHEYYTELRSPLRLQVKGRIQSVEGAGADRVILDRALRRAGKGSYGHIIHLTLGVNPAARWTGRSFIEDMRVIGNNAVGFGVPFWEPGGGENHPDGVIVNQSVWIDGEQVVADGIIVTPSSLAAEAAALLPRIY
jgi:leucyl aminopeptidase (aminopeptidase T)